MIAWDVRVRWMLGWANDPTLELSFTEIPDRADFRFREFPTDDGRMLISRKDPISTFIFESKHGGGALGGTFLLESGGETRTNGGWSSRPGAINRMREADPALRKYLPQPLVDATIYRAGGEDWGTGRAGFCFDLDWIEWLVADLIPDVFLRREDARDEPRWVPRPRDGREKPDHGETVGGSLAIDHNKWRREGYQVQVRGHPGTHLYVPGEPRGLSPCGIDIQEAAAEFHLEKLSGTRAGLITRDDACRICRDYALDREAVEA